MLVSSPANEDLDPSHYLLLPIDEFFPLPSNTLLCSHPRPTLLAFVLRDQLSLQFPFASFACFLYPSIFLCNIHN
jgi:hypothetical protein